MFRQCGVRGNFTPLLDTTLTEFPSVTSADLAGVFLTLREAARQMIQLACVATGACAPVGGPDDIAGVAVYLASAASRDHTGDVLRIDGGYLKF